MADVLRDIAALSFYVIAQELRAQELRALCPGAPCPMLLLKGAPKEFRAPSLRAPSPVSVPFPHKGTELGGRLSKENN